MIPLAQANLLADLARTIRPAWDTRAIVKHIGEVKHRTVPEIAWALLTVAADPAMKTPAALTFDGPHWRAPEPLKHPQPYRREDRTGPLTERGQAYIEQAKQAAAEARTRYALAAQPTEEA